MLRMVRLSTLSLALGLISVVACDDGAPVGDGGDTGVDGDATVSTGGERGDWPREFVVGPGTGPTLYLNEGADAPALGYVSPGVGVEIAGLPRGNNRVPVRIRGALKVRAWMGAERLAQYVQARGRVDGTPTYVGPGNLVQILGPTADGLRVRVTPRLGCEPSCSLPPHEGVLPNEQLAASEPTDAEDVRPGEPKSLPPGQELPLYDRPNGDVVATLPATDPPLVVSQLVSRNGWHGLRVGLGPYLIGFTDQELPAAESLPTAEETAPSEGVPARLQAEADKPLWRVPVDTRVRFDGDTVGIFAEQGFAREMNRYDSTGEVDVFVAVNDEVALRGMVRIAELEMRDMPAQALRARGHLRAPRRGDEGCELLPAIARPIVLSALGLFED